ARLQRNGAIDSSFNGKGTFAIGFAEGDNGARAVAVQPDGKILLGGYVVGLILARLKTEGTLDSSFNRNGIQTTIIGTSSTLKGMTLYRSRLYAVGSTTLETGEIDGVIAAYQLQSATNGLCCFTGPDGQKAVCGTQVNQNNCQLSGENAFFLGTVSDCSIIDTATLCARSLTPVTLSANYVEDTKTVMLTWKMESEHKTTGYNIQRSRDGETFKTIGFISSNASGHYSFSDFYPLEEGFYKLVWFESRGFESDKVLAVALPSGKLQLLPNPTSSQVRLILKELQSHEAQVWVYDNTARIVLTLKLTKDQLPQIDVTSLVSGAYYVMVKVEGKVYTEKLLKK
ncbi:MAG TPA: T9SS type A sorting domain-containing protein, partial [Flavisolibacter sp.]|nr:T9SS type A sorting domain-containing protein [Flavisolibacter sp.]